MGLLINRLIEENLHVGELMQFKPMLFKGQLYMIHDWLNLQMQVWGAGLRDLRVCRLWYLCGSWNYSLKDTKR